MIICNEIYNTNNNNNINPCATAERARADVSM